MSEQKNQPNSFKPKGKLLNLIAQKIKASLSAGIACLGLNEGSNSSPSLSLASLSPVLFLSQALCDGQDDDNNSKFREKKDFSIFS